MDLLRTSASAARAVSTRSHSLELPYGNFVALRQRHSGQGCPGSRLSLSQSPDHDSRCGRSCQGKSFSVHYPSLNELSPGRQWLHSFVTSWLLPNQFIFSRADGSAATNATRARLCVLSRVAHSLLPSTDGTVAPPGPANMAPSLTATNTEAVGVSRSAVSRQVLEASEKKLQELAERRWDDTEILILYIDGQRFGEHHILSAVGVDAAGKKHILGIEYGATENAAAVKRLLVHLRDHGLSTERKYLFVIDGSQALRRGIDEVFGQHNPVQRCRNHKK